MGNHAIFKGLKKKLPEYFSSFPIKKEEIIKAIVDSEKNLKKITKIVHPKYIEKLNIFLKNNKKEDDSSIRHTSFIRK